jgi:predicted RNA-binding protein with PIN domain
VRWLIDGYNVIRRDPDLRAKESVSLEAGRRALVHLVAALARRSRDDFTVVFDGARRGEALPGGGRVTVLFSRPPETADDVVIRLAERFRAGAVVVTSDRRIAHAAGRAQSGVVDAATFVERARITAESAAAGAAAGAAPADPGLADKDDDVDDRPARKSGNPRRPSKKARAAARALRRLHPS